MKKQFTYIFIALTSLAISACSNDETQENINFNAAVVQPAPDFVDPRDGQVYSCVQIGNQVWMTRNLAYQLPGNSLKGCFTWNEVYFDSDEAFEIPDETFVNLGLDLLLDTQYHWSDLILKRCKDLLLWTEQGYFTQEQTLGMMESLYEEFYVVFKDKLANLRNDPEAIKAVGLVHFKQAEAENGGYVSKYGFLYSYEAALASVPEGWRLPSDDDWKELETTLGMSKTEADKMDAWRGEGIVSLLQPGGAAKFNLELAGGNIYAKERSYKYDYKDARGYYWTSTSYLSSDSIPLAIYRQSANFSNKLWRGSSRLSNQYRPVLYSVRLVRNAQ